MTTDPPIGSTASAAAGHPGRRYLCGNVSVDRDYAWTAVRLLSPAHGRPSVVRAVNTLIHPGQLHLQSLAIGVVVGRIAMPALAGLLMLVGYRTIKPDDLRSVWETGATQKAVVATSFVLTMVIPLQYAVLAGVGLS